MLNVESTYKDILPRFALNWQLSETQRVYVQAARGYRTTTPNVQINLNVGRPFLDPDFLWNYEVGAKTQWWDGRVLLNGSLYQIDWSDLQADRVGTARIGLLPIDVIYIDNIGDARILGAELELVGFVTQGWSVMLGLAYQDGRLVKLSEGSTAIPDSRIPNSPKWSGSLVSTYSVPLSADCLLSFTGSVQYVDDQASTEVTPQDPSGSETAAYTQLGVTIGLDGERWGLSLFGSNLLDEIVEVQNASLTESENFTTLAGRARSACACARISDRASCSAASSPLPARSCLVLGSCQPSNARLRDAGPAVAPRPQGEDVDRSLLRIDLNLLKALYILLQERNVTRAADRLFITQSAMSKTLHRLREALNDPLLIRTSSGLVPTPRAERLAIDLAAAFEHLESCIAPTSFDPAAVAGRLRIAAPETFAVGIMPTLLARLRATAPSLQIESLHLTDDYADQLAAGTIDFVAYLDQPYPDGLITHKLFSAAPMIWCRRQHPIVTRKPITLEDICDYPKVAFHSPSIPRGTLHEILQALERADLGREVLFETSHLLLALIMLSQSDALMLAPDYLFRHPMFASDIVARPISHIPLFDHLRIDLGLIQHERTVNSALHQWVAAEAVNAFSPDSGTSATEDLPPA